MEEFYIIAVLAIGSGALSLLCLIALHLVSPEFNPGWRMVSEYALGNHKWLLTFMFIFWSFSSISTAYLLWSIVTTKWAMAGTILILISGVGALMGGMFDIKHKLHGLSFMLGIPTMPIGALLVSYNLDNRWSSFQPIVLWSAHAIWISLVLMGVSMVLLFSGFKKAGMPMDKNTAPPETLPPGVIGINGYFNRILIFCYIGWQIVIANIYLTL